VLGVVSMQWWGLIQQVVLGHPWGNRPASDTGMVLLWLVFGIGLPLFFCAMRLIVVVTDDAVEIRYRPLTRRSIPMAEISRVQARTYAPILEYGGWGIRGWGGRRAYSTSGNRGAEITLTNGYVVMIGSRRADELADAIAEARSAWAEARGGQPLHVQEERQGAIAGDTPRGSG
jgi:hypothetical protein